ncbi:cysteine--tRNA ligase [Catenulispora pinisilvae]|uniref:cysteine--tRNA ligase n=1 Tax=Catenulispora pinisilvae TaxID=2705253 RepID=UPI001891C480|nr:cysteine--tRNA ligase [Catenulispora pinisilvae]
MTLRLYDTAARATREFVPVTPGKVSIYLCGATVQAPPHIGHVRSNLSFDIVRRWFEYRGYDVTFVRNVTDIDDKIIRKAAEQDVETWRVAQANEYAFQDAYRLLGCEDPSVEPRATGHIPEMIAMMRTLIDNGHAYAAGGDVYFRVRSLPEYGALAHFNVNNLEEQPLDDVAPETHKEDPHDFTLWKASKPGEPFWDTPWGPGRPGWHLECSAMAHRYLGTNFDIHGGGVDLIFPHHENEQAQSHAFGDKFTNYWMHNGWVTLKNVKMSKSLGNSVLVTELAKQYRPVVLRYYLGTPHYRSMIEYTDTSLHEADAAYSRIEGFVTRALETVGPTEAAAEVPAAFAESMDDDFGVPGAVAVLHNTVREGNTALAGGDKEGVATHLASVLTMLDVLGLNPLAEPWSGAAGTAGSGTDLRPVVDTLVKVALEQRQAARERKDYAASDAIRDQLARAGVTVEDTPGGPRWTVN